MFYLLMLRGTMLGPRQQGKYPFDPLRTDSITIPQFGESHKVLLEQVGSVDFLSFVSKFYTESGLKVSVQGAVVGTVYKELMTSFSCANLRPMLRVPSTLDELLQWKVHDISMTKDGLKNYVDNLCGLLNQNDPHFCENSRALVEHIVATTFSAMVVIILDQVKQLIEALIKSQKDNVALLTRKGAEIQRQLSSQSDKILKTQISINGTVLKYRQQITQLKEELSKTDVDKDTKSYKEQMIETISSQIELLESQQKEMQDQIKDQQLAPVEINTQTREIQGVISALRTVLAHVFTVIAREKNLSIELQNSWNTLSTHFANLEKKAQEQKNEQAKKAQEEKAAETKAAQDEAAKQKAETDMLANLGKQFGGDSKSADNPLAAVVGILGQALG